MHVSRATQPTHARALPFISISHVDFVLHVPAIEVNAVDLTAFVSMALSAKLIPGVSDFVRDPFVPGFLESSVESRCVHLPCEESRCLLI